MLTRATIGILCLVVMFGPVARAGTLEEVRSGGLLHCGVDAEAKGFSHKDDAGTWQGLHVDFCRAVAAAVLGDGRKVNFLGLTAEEQVEALQSGEIDVLVSALSLSSALEFQNGLMVTDPIYFGQDGARPFFHAPVVRQGDDLWFATIKWVRHALVLTAERRLSHEGTDTLFTTLDNNCGDILTAGWAQRSIEATGDLIMMLKRAGFVDQRNTVVSQKGMLWAPQP